jgi:hypothetical protein
MGDDEAPELCVAASEIGPEDEEADSDQNQEQSFYGADQVSEDPKSN